MSPEDNRFYNQFYQKYIRLIHYFAKRYTATPSDCEDLAQDTALRLMRNIPSLRVIADNPGKTAYYICAAVQSTFVDNLRTDRNVNYASYPDDVLDTLIEERLLAQRMPFDTSYWDVQLMKERLPKRDWEILEGKFIIGYTDEELAERVGCSKDSVRMAVTRAKRKARAVLLDNDTDGGGSHEQQTERGAGGAI